MLFFLFLPCFHNDGHIAVIVGRIPSNLKDVRFSYLYGIKLTNIQSDGSTVIYEYNENGYCIKETVVNSNGSIDIYEYNENGTHSGVCKHCGTSVTVEE